MKANCELKLVLKITGKNYFKTLSFIPSTKGPLCVSLANGTHKCPHITVLPSPSY